MILQKYEKINTNFAYSYKLLVTGHKIENKEEYFNKNYNENLISKHK
jgi:hypothetical protein